MLWQRLSMISLSISRAEDSVLRVKLCCVSAVITSVCNDRKTVVLRVALITGPINLKHNQTFSKRTICLESIFLVEQADHVRTKSQRQLFHVLALCHSIIDFNCVAGSCYAIIKNHHSEVWKSTSRIAGPTFNTGRASKLNEMVLSHYQSTNIDQHHLQLIYCRK